jgi:hypothetical protein
MHYASMAYVSRDRVADGQVHDANVEIVAQEVYNFSKEFAPSISGSSTTLGITELSKFLPDT